MMKKLVILLASFFVCSSAALFAAYSPFLQVEGGVTETLLQEECWTSLEGGGSASPLFFEFGPWGVGAVVKASYTTPSFVKEDLLLPSRLSFSSGLGFSFRWERFLLPLSLDAGFLYYPALFGATMFWGIAASPTLLLTENLGIGIDLEVDSTPRGTMLKASLGLRIEGGRDA